MSHHLVNSAMDVSLPGTPKLVLCVIAHRAVMSTRAIESTTVADLAEACGLSPSCVRDQLGRLTRSGLISIERLPKPFIRIQVGTF